jgi:hypothetical protein
VKSFHKALGLWLLLVTAQQGAVVHELSHLAQVSHTQTGAQAGLPGEQSCALCPAYAQAASPAFSHSITIPLLVRTALERDADPQTSAISADLPQPRSRGPPTLS